ncbi:oxysterol-binding protein-related protein 9 isoform X2 [Arctopsyche grandis]|uniref:oxysterol-binding protein-related protein 9 isoform X2 n=1 Tax=Arctopsyche grandis TaxID=121162 RepID=UPI00406D6D84
MTLGAGQDGAKACRLWIRRIVNWICNFFKSSKEKMMRGVRRGCVRLRAAVVGIDDEDDSNFTITVDHKTFHFQARDAEERERWVRALEDTILRHGRVGRGTTGIIGVPGNGGGGIARARPLDFERRVSEADAYLQIMIDQVNKLKDRISDIVDPDDKVKCQGIHDQANAMLENIKHSIVLLQIAKNTVNPVNGIYQGPTSIISTDEIPSAIPTDGPAMSLVVPDTSYSSSEEEDDFYDADDAPFSSSSLVGTPTTVSRQQTEPPPARSDTSLSDDRTLPRNKDGSIDYDALYECESDSDIGSMETHGSVVTHLLSQVKIGMDLTKVVLPTFILERRSLLEMYADYFAHPDQFIRIADMPTPRDRMVQVIRWYLSSYHAGRKSTVAKKPYNPILGEIFRCHWQVSNGGVGGLPVSEGPVPWCGPDQLTFVAEQVSHHPPISAFYAEHVNKRISFDAWVWTKSKFLGLSIGVHNIGKGTVTLPDLQEEYVLTFPNGYGRSILTVPWIELGGTVTVECAATGHKGTIEFLTKPFYGGKRNRVSCEVFGPGDKKPFLTAQGEWNTHMEMKWTENGRTEILFDASRMRAQRKLVRAIGSQATNESRRVWRDVTVGLRADDIDGATRAKCIVEQAQRESAKQREITNQPWETALFKNDGEDGWEFINPLKNRQKDNNSLSNDTSKSDSHYSDATSPTDVQLR